MRRVIGKRENLLEKKNRLTRRRRIVIEVSFDINVNRDSLLELFFSDNAFLSLKSMIFFYILYNLYTHSKLYLLMLEGDIIINLLILLLHFQGLTSLLIFFKVWNKTLKFSLLLNFSIPNFFFYLSYNIFTYNIKNYDKITNITNFFLNFLRS